MIITKKKFFIKHTRYGIKLYICGVKLSDKKQQKLITLKIKKYEKESRNGNG